MFKKFKQQKNNQKQFLLIRIFSAPVCVKSALVCGRSQGFTLIELLVTISMFVILTGVVLVNSSKFDNSILLHNFAYDVALTIKQAQSYGVNVRESSSGSFDAGYGVYFDVDINGSGSKTNFVLFNDIAGLGGTGNPDKIYNNEPNGVKSCLTNNPECIKKYSIKKGIFIKSICAGSSESDCDNNGNTNQLSILFKRPKLNSLIYSSKDNYSIPQSFAKIILSSSNNVTSSIIITSVGQIYVKK